VKRTTFFVIQAITLGAVGLQATLLYLSQRYLPPLVPLWYTLPWGETQLAPSLYLALLPALTLLLGQANILLIWWINRHQDSGSQSEAGEVSRALISLNILVSLALTFSLNRIINLVSLPQPRLLPFDLTPLTSPFVVSFLLSLALSPLVVRLAKKVGAVDDPATHRHPAILHTTPIPRAGALAFYLSLLVTGLLFLPLTKITLGIYLAAGLTTLVGLADDRYDLSPYFRLGVLLPLAAALVLVAGVNLRAFAHPLGGVIRVDIISIPLGSHFISLPADILAFVWLIWIMNLLSWSNGVDGQFTGIVGFTFMTLAVLSLRPSAGDLIPPEVSTLAALSAGAALGLAPFTWHPAKFFWGFGATTAGLLIATLSILSGAKVATASLVMIVPTADALTAVVRRVKRGQSPVWGDREHLHHKLLNRGWTHAQVALFYWAATATCGLITIWAADNPRVLSLLIGGGLLAFVAILTNLKPNPSPQK